MYYSEPIENEVETSEGRIEEMGKKQNKGNQKSYSGTPTPERKSMQVYDELMSDSFSDTYLTDRR